MCYKASFSYLKLGDKLNLKDIKEILEWKWTIQTAVGALLVIIGSLFALKSTIAEQLPIWVRLLIFMICLSATYYIFITSLQFILKLLIARYKRWHETFSLIMSISKLEKKEQITLFKNLKSNGKYLRLSILSRIKDNKAIIENYSKRNKLIKVHWPVRIYIQKTFTRIRHEKLRKVINTLSAKHINYLSIFYDVNKNKLKNQNGLIPYQIPNYYDSLSQYNLVIVHKINNATQYELDKIFAKKLASKYFKNFTSSNTVEFEDTEVQATPPVTTGGGHANGNNTPT